MSKISFVLFSYNEEQRIELIIKNLIPYGEVLVMDGGSTDGTKEIAERLGAKFFIRPKIESVFLETENMFEFVKEKTGQNWVYWGYVDNFLPKTLLKKMTEIAEQDKYKIVSIPVFTYLWGDTKNPVIKASYNCFFHKSYMDFKRNLIHQTGTFTGQKSERLELHMKEEFALRHFSLYDLNKFVQGHLRYAEAEAQQKFSRGKKVSVWYLLGSPVKYFWLFYKRGYKLGFKGLYIALLYAFFRVMVAVRWYELERGLNLQNIEESYRAEKKRIVESLNQ